MKAKKISFYFLVILILTACSSVAKITSSKMDKLELGMSKKQVALILGDKYTIAEKRVENGIEVEVLSYRNFPRDDEFYLFLFAGDKLEKWYRELVPKYEFKDN